MTETSTTTTIAAALAATVTLLPEGVEHRISHGTWLELARRAGGCECGTTTDTNGPAWDWVDHTGDARSPLAVRGAWGGESQCGQCGRLGSGWITTGARDIADLTDPVDLTDLDGLTADEIADAVTDAVTEMATELDATWRAAIDTLADSRRAELATELGDWLTALAAAGGDEDAARAGWTGCQVDHSGATPGITDIAGEWVAWDWAPGTDGDMIEVRAEDIR